MTKAADGEPEHDPNARLVLDDLRFYCKPFDALTVRELDALYRLRQEVFVLEQNCIYADADGLDSQCWHIWATLGDAPDASAAVVAVARLLPAGVQYAECAIGRVASHPQVRGKGVGRALFAYALEQAAVYHAGTAGANGTNGAGVRISAQLYLQGFRNLCITWHASVRCCACQCKAGFDIKGFSFTRRPTQQWRAQHRTPILLSF